MSSPATKSRIGPTPWRKPRRLESRNSPDNTQRITATRLWWSSQAAISQKSTTRKGRWYANRPSVAGGMFWGGVVGARAIHPPVQPAARKRGLEFPQGHEPSQDLWDPLKYIRLGSDDWYL